MLQVYTDDNNQVPLFEPVRAKKVQSMTLVIRQCLCGSVSTVSSFRLIHMLQLDPSLSRMVRRAKRTAWHL